MTDPHALLQTDFAAAVANRYELDRVLGSGGAAVVFLGRDLRSGERVAIKVLRPDLAATVATDRFLREISVAGRLYHPHIVPLLDSGTAGGYLYYTLPFVEGESLRHRIKREHQIPIDAVVEVAVGVAKALAYAHGQDVLHRDLKPENILLRENHPLVADFGLARAAIPTSADGLTSTGIVVGTPAYMSPEQADGRAEARSDLYGLGCVIYEMLVGEPPFGGRTAQAIIARHAQEAVPEIRIVRPSVPVELEAIVYRCLEKAAADRPATALDLAGALAEIRSPRIIGRAAVPLAGPRPVYPAIAVLPFTTAGSDPDQEYLGDAMMEELVVGLTKISGLRVASRASVHALRATVTDLEGWGRRLGVAAVLSGTIRRSGESLRVTAELTAVDGGYNLWAGTFSGGAADVPSIQDEIAGAIVETLRPTIGGLLKQPLIKPRTDDPAAYHAYLRGRYLWAKRVPDALRRALDCFAEALTRDPDYALAYCGLADVYISMSQFQHAPPSQVFPRAEAAVRRAIELEPDLPAAHVSLAHIHEVYHWDWEAAERTYLEALAIDPKYPTGHAWYADFLMETGRETEAVAEMALAKSLEPLSIPIAFQAATLNYRSTEKAPIRGRRLDEAILAYREITDLEPAYLMAHAFLGAALARRGRYDEAIQHLQEVDQRAGGRPFFRMVLSYAFGLAGRVPEATAILDQLTAMAKEAYVPPAFFAIGWGAVGQLDRAFDQLTKACDERSLLMAILRIEPLVDPLRDDPRFDHTLVRVFGRR